MTTEEASVQKVGVLGNDDEVLVCGQLPEGLIVTVGQPEILDML